MIVYRGISRLDRKTPIVVILTGVKDRSTNSKTGGMVQSYILVDATAPKAAINSKADYAVCGNCYHRGNATRKRTCYVSTRTGLGAVGRQLLARKYPDVAPEAAALQIAGRKLRIGTYGDPAAVPPEVWRTLLAHTSGNTGYTHQWREFSDMKDIVMASVDDPREYPIAKYLGWRTFRVRHPTGDALAPTEVTCPASTEAGHRVTCEDCNLCQGASRVAKDVAIIDHSAQARAVTRRLQVLQ